MMKMGNLLYAYNVLNKWVFQQEDSDQPEITGSILEPDPLTFTFETIGWKILGGILLLLLIILSYKRLKLYQKNKYRRKALKRIQFISAEESGNADKIKNFNIVLKQVAIEAFGRDRVAELYGVEWLLFLDSKAKNCSFAQYDSSFTDAMYSNKEIDGNKEGAIYKLTKTWIHEHA